PRRNLESRYLQHCWPEQGVEVDDVLADEVDDACSRIFVPVVEGAFGLPRVLSPFLRGRDVADGRVQPDVEVLVLLPRDGETEVGTVPTDVPVGQALLEELTQLVRYCRMQKVGLTDERLQLLGVPRKAEEQVGGDLPDRRGSTQRTARVD